MTDTQHNNRAHAVLSPSKAERWINCSGSIAAEAMFPDNRTSRYASEGTAAHQLSEIVMREWLTNIGANRFQHPQMPAWVIPHHYATLPIRDVLVKHFGDKITADGLVFLADAEMIESVGVYLDAVVSLLEPDALIWTEHRLPLDPFLPGTFGTCDMIVYNPRTLDLHIIDLKYGRGVAVDAVENPQLVLYATGCAQALALPIDRVTMIIAQPRAYHGDGAVRPWPISAAELFERAMKISVAGKKALEPGAPRAAGDWCRWCKASAVCDTFREKAVAESGLNFGSATQAPSAPASVKGMPPEELGRLLDLIKILKPWISEVEELAEDAAKSGFIIPGYKLVAQRARREYIDSTAAAAAIGNALVAAGLDPVGAYELEVISPASAEKKLGKSAFREHVSPHVRSVSPGVTLAPASDSRAAIDPGASRAGVELFAMFPAQTVATAPAGDDPLAWAQNGGLSANPY